MATTSERKCGRRGPVVGRDRDGGLGEHDVGDDRTADAARHLGGQVGRSVPPAQPAKGGVDKGDDRVEVRARDRAEHQDDGEQTRLRWPPRSRTAPARRCPGESCWAAMPEPMTMAARNALPEELGHQPAPEGGSPIDRVASSAPRSASQQQDEADRWRPIGRVATAAAPLGRLPGGSPCRHIGVGEHGVDLPAAHRRGRPPIPCPAGRSSSVVCSSIAVASPAAASRAFRRHLLGRSRPRRRGG